MNKDEALKLALEALELIGMKNWSLREDKAITAIKEALAQPEPVAWKYDVTYNQDGTVSVALPDGDELRIVLPNQQEPYCWTWDVWVSGGKWRAEYGWKKPTEKVVNLQPLYAVPPQQELVCVCGAVWEGQELIYTTPQRKPLSEEEIGAILEDVNAYGTRLYTFARAIEAAHGIKEKNHG